MCSLSDDNVPFLAFSLPEFDRRHMYIAGKSINVNEVDWHVKAQPFWPLATYDESGADRPDGMCGGSSYCTAITDKPRRLSLFLFVATRLHIASSLLQPALVVPLAPAYH